MLLTWFSLLKVIVAVAINQSNIVHVSVYSSLHIHSCLWGSMFVLYVSYSVYVQPSYMFVCSYHGYNVYRLINEATKYWVDGRDSTQLRLC